MRASFCFFYTDLSLCAHWTWEKRARRYVDLRLRFWIEQNLDSFTRKSIFFGHEAVAFRRTACDSMRARALRNASSGSAWEVEIPALCPIFWIQSRARSANGWDIRSKTNAIIRLISNTYVLLLSFSMHSHRKCFYSLEREELEHWLVPLPCPRSSVL